MAGIELLIKHEDDGGEAWLEITDAVAKETGSFCTIDADSLDLLEAILKVRKPGTYTFYTEE